ncbi:hypothetical protein [Nonomuraea jiangxiensis]|uniref:hypothetical protein n=1 Tax=Nonomuraea jiangxiensis TaxID=633440 RepID=UPI00115FB6BD|nr:hypothetical protein [Nonomuraea jiangxiensis]
MSSVGHLAGLRPRGRSGAGGDVRGADVELVDALDLPTWRTVVAWLRDTPSMAGRRSRLQILAAFMRWLRTLDPATELLAASGTHLDRYCEAARSGALTVGVRTPGKPLAGATVARRRTALSSFYAYAWQYGAVRQTHAAAPPPARAREAVPRRGSVRDTDPQAGTDTGSQAGTDARPQAGTDAGQRVGAARDAGSKAGTDGGQQAGTDTRPRVGAVHDAGSRADGAPVPGVTPEERRLLRQGVGRLAAEGRSVEAAAVALLEATGASAATLARLTAQDIHAGAEGGDGRPGIIVLRDAQDGVVAFPLTARIRSLLRQLCSSRPAGESLIRRDDGDPVDGAWLGRVLREAAQAGGIPERRAEALHPQLLRATTVADLPRG